MIDADGGDTATAWTVAGVTVMAAWPVTPSLTAVIVAFPGAIAVTSPDPDTIATAGLLLFHANERPLSVPPPRSFATAVSCFVDPASTVLVAGVTWTDATAGGWTVIAALPDTPSMVAVMVDDPIETAVTTP